MLYLGGKGRIGKEVAATILRATSKRADYLEPFVGGGAAFKHLAPGFKHVRAGDIHHDLMLMWQAAANGWTPPDIVSEDDYKAIRQQPASALTGFVGFGCSFGGKWWGGYARSAANGNGYYARHAAASVLEIASMMPPNVLGELRCAQYTDWIVTPECVVYADPPYANTTRYRDKFDNDAFWRVATSWAQKGADVFVSEYAAPEGWYPIWEKAQRRKVSGGTGATTYEKLFTYNRK